MTTPNKDRPAGEENDAATKPAPVTEPVVASTQAAETGGAKRIRCRHGDRFVISKDLIVDGTWREYPATRAKEIIEAAGRNGVRLAVADVEKKG